MSMLDFKNTFGLETKFYIKSQGKRGGKKKIISFGGIWTRQGIG